MNVTNYQELVHIFLRIHDTIFVKYRHTPIGNAAKGCCSPCNASGLSLTYLIEFLPSCLPLLSSLGYSPLYSSISLSLEGKKRNTNWLEEAAVSYAIFLLLLLVNDPLNFSAFSCLNSIVLESTIRIFGQW